MKSYILQQTAAIFFSIELISKTGYWLRVCHGWFYLQGLPRAVRNASRARITKWKFIAHCGIRTRGLRITKRRCYHWATKTDISRVDKSLPGFNCTIFRNLHVAWSRGLLRTKRRRSDSVLWQKPLHPQKCQKGIVTTQTTPQKIRLNSGRSVGIQFCVYFDTHMILVSFWYLTNFKRSLLTVKSLQNVIHDKLCC